MQFLITGATGFVGNSLCAELVRRGQFVRAAQRFEVQNVENIEVVKVGSINGDTDYGEVLRNVDVVIHLAARVHVMHDTASNPLDEFRKVNVAGTERLARSAAAYGVRRLVYVSSIKVSGEATLDGKQLTELDEVLPQDPYGISKWEAEQALDRVAKETGLEVVIIRPPLVYGAGVKGNFAEMMKVLAKDIPLPLASVKNDRSLIYVENLVDALIVCANHPAAKGQTYLVSNDEDISTPDLLRQLGDAMGHPARLFSFPQYLIKIAGRLVGKSDQIDRLLGSLRVDSNKIRRELSWKPPYSLQQSLCITGRSFFNFKNKLEQ